MFSYRNKKIIPVALMLILFAIVIAALVSLARVVFFPNDNNDALSRADISKETLLSTGANNSVVLDVRGPIVADESFMSYKIKITTTSREFMTYKGYEPRIVDKVSLGNSTKAYEQFVFALYKANLIKGAEFTGDKNDTRGVCATGRIYSFQIVSADKIIKQLWVSTCPGSKGSLNANVDQLISLFTDQIPESKKIIINKVW